MGRKIFDYNSVPVDPTLYTPQTSEKTDSSESWFEGGTPIVDNPNYERSFYDDTVGYSGQLIDPTKMRADNQGGLNKIVTAIAKGSVTGALGAVEYAGYLGDVQEWIGGDTDEVDAAYTNWLSESAKGAKEDVESAMPVYMQDPNALWDNGDIAGSVAKALGSTVDSAVSFGLLGLAVAATGGTALGAFGTTMMGAGLLRVSTALAMNYVESKQMASQAISDTKSLLDEKLQAGEISEIDYYKGLEEASVQANHFIWKNKLNTWQDFLALRGLKNITAGTRALAKEATKPMNRILDATGESFEEVTSGFGQNEIGYEARKAAGIKDPSEPTSAIDRAFNYVTSEQGIYEGVLGAIGGPIQSYAFNKPIEKFVTKKSYQDKVKRQKEQEEFYGRNKESILATAAKQKATTDKLNKALESGDLDAAAEHHAETFADLAFNNFKMGTTEKLEEHIDDILKDDTVDPKLKEFALQYKKDLPSYEKEYVKIVNRRNEEAAAKKVGDMEQLVHHANIASEFKLFVLKNHNENQISKVNDEIAKLDSKITSAGYLDNETLIQQHQSAVISKNSEIDSINQMLKSNKNLTEEQKAGLKTKIAALRTQVKDLNKITKASGLETGQISAKVQNLLDDKHDLVKKRLDFETANISFDNQIKDIRDNKFTPDIIANIRLTNLAAANLKAGKNTISTNDEVKKAGETAIENMDPESFEIDKEAEAKKAEEQRLKDIKTYTDTIIARAKEISADTKLTPKQKANKLGALTASVEQNYDLNPTENDKQALNLQGYILKHTEEQVNLLNESEKKDYIKESKKPKPVAEATKNALIKTPKFFTNSNIPTANTFTDYTMVTQEELSELLKNTPIETINSKVELVVRRFDTKPDNNPTDLKNGYYTARNQIRNVVAIVYDGKVLGYIYEPNKFFTLDSKTNKLTPVNFETLPESEVRKLYPNGDIQALRDSWKEAQDLQKFISTKSTSETQVLSNEELQKIGFKVNSFFGEYDLYNSITEWGDLSTISEAMVTLSDGKQTHIIYDSYQQAMMSNYPSQTSELLSTLDNKKPSPNLKNRYSILLQLGNGTYEWVAIAPKPADTIEVFKTIYDAVKTAVQTKVPIDYNNNPFRNLFIYTEGGLTNVSLRFAENGIIFTFENRVGEGSKEVRIRLEEFNKIKSFEDLVALVNKRIGNELPNNEYIPRTSDGNVLQLQISDFRKSVIVGKEAGNVSETTDLSKDFNISVKPTIFKPVQNLNISSDVRTAEDIVNEDPSSYNPNDPFRQAIAEPDFDNGVPEGAEVFTDEVEVVAEAKVDQPKEDTTTKPLTVKEKLAARQAAKAAKTAQGRNNDIDGPMKVGTSLNYNYDYDAAQTWLEDRLPSTISVQDLHSVLEKLKVNGIPMGMLMNNIVYLSQSAERGTEYHEAFHAAFRLLSTESEITNILNQAKKEFKAPTKEELSRLKNQAAQNAFLTEGELLDLYYEEKLADKFQDITLNKKSASWLGNLYNKIKAWLRFYTNNMDTIEATFYKLDRGLYKNSTIKANRYNNLENFGVLKLLTKGVNEESNIRKTASSELSNKIIYTAAAWIGNQIQSDNGLKSFDENFEKFLNMMSSKYDWNNEEQANYYIGLMEDMEEESQKEAFLEKIDEYYILYTDEANRAIIKEQAEALLKTFKVDSTEEKEKEKLAEDVSERFDVDFFTLGGFDSMTAPVKEFIGLTLYETTDEFGNKMQSGVDFIKVYNGLTATLAGAEDSEMIPRMMLFKKHNTQTEAVIQKFIEATGLQLSEDGKSHTYDADKSNEYHLLLNAFKKEKVSFFTILHDAGKRENSKAATRIIESNRKSSKQLQASNWASNFGSSFVRSKNDPEFKDSLINALNDAMTVFEVSKPLSEADLQKLAIDLKSHLSKVGMTISQGYAEYSIASYQVNNFPTYATDVVRNIYEPFANTISQDLIVSQTHLFEMKSALLRGENIYAKEVTKEDLKTKKKVKSVGTFTRILKMSEGNTFFDENVIESTFTNAENQKVYNYLLRNQLMTKAKDFRDAGKRNALSNGGFINNLNHLLNFKHSSAIFSNYNVSLIDGIKPSVIDNVEDADSIKTMEGTTFGSMDDVQYLQTVLSFFGDQKEIKYGTDGEVVKTAKYVFRQLEASNTGAIVDLPVFEYYVINKEGKLQVTPLFKEHLGNYIQQEWDRIGREFANSTNESRDIYTGYNDKPDGRAFKFWAFPQLNGKYEELAKKNGALDTTTRAEMVDIMVNSLAKEFQDFKTVLTESNLLTKDGLTIGDNLAYSTADKWIGDFFTNDFLNSLGLNQMYDGDYAVGRKDFIDMVKRHKGSIGYGIDMGEGYTNIVTVEDPIKYVDKETFTSFSELNDEDKKSIIASEIAMYKESNPNATEDDVKKFIDSKVHEIKVGDAQSYVTVEHVIAQLKRLGRFGKKVSAIYDKILEGKNITYAEVKILEKARAALNSRKTVIFDGDVYYKLSEIPLSPSLVNTPGFEWHKNLLASMKAPGANVDQMVFRSASKAAQKNVVKFSEDGNFDFSKSVNPVENKYKRLQVETPSGKEDITAGTQLINLIISEQNPDLIVNYRGQEVTVRDLQQIYYKLLEDVRDVSFKAASSFLVDVNGKKDPKKAAKKFAETVESSGGSELQIRYFSPDENGNPKYNWNIAPIIEKAEELFLAHFNKAYSVQKVEGSKVSLVSDVGVRINGESLKWGKKDDTGKVWSECLMPRYIAELFELKEGDAIPDEAAEMLGYRIPTQDKHSMVSLRVKGFLPNEYGSVIIVPKEVVLLSGADFDIDSLYISRYGVYRDADRKLIRYGTATTVEGKFDEFLNYNISKNKDLKTMVKDFKLSNALNIKARMEETGKKKAEVINEFYPLFFKSLGLPGTLEEFAEVTKGGTVDINKGSLDNKILDAQMSLFNNSHIQETIAKTPATIDSLKTISKTVLAARTKAKTIVDSSSYNGFSIMGRFYAFVNNTEGKRNIGPTALTNVANAELTTQNIEYSYAPLIKNPSVDLVNSEIAELFKNDTYLYLYVNGKLVTGYSDTLDSNGNRKADSLSTVLSAMTDNAKEALANLVNLGYDIIPIVNHAITQGIDLESAILMVNTPDMITYGKAKKAAKRLGDNSVKIADMIPLVLKGTEDLKLTEEEKDLILNPPLIAQSRNITTELLQNLISLNPKTTIIDKVIPRNEKIMYLTYRVLVLKALSTLDEQQKFIMNFTSLQSLYKGSNVSFEENERFVNAINTLGVYKFFKDEKIKALYARGGSLYRETTDTTKDTFDLTRLFKNNSSLVALAENFSRINGPISQEYFISRTPTFTRLTKTMYPAVSGAERYQIARQLLTFISTHVYKRAVANNPDNFMHKLMVDMGVSDSFGGLMKTKDGLTIGEELLDVKGNLKNRGQRNYLLDRLSIEEDNIGMVTIEFPSMSKFNNGESNKLTDAFLELYSDDSTREFSKKLFLYLFFKDNFKFRNNTFINNVADFMFSDYSKSLDTIQNEFSKDAPNFSELGFSSESQLFNTFADIFIPDYNNKDLLITIGSLKSLANGTLKDVLKFANVKYESGKTGVTLSVNKEELRKFLRDNKTLSKTVKYTITKLVQTKVDDAFSGIPGFIATEKEDVKSSDPSNRSNSRIVKSTYRLIADNEKEVVYAEMPQVGKKNLSPYAFTLKSLSNIAAMVQSKRDEAYTKRRIDSIFTPVSGQIVNLELGANKILENSTKIGTEISSNAKGLAAALTNPTELAKSKGNLKESYPIIFNGITYKDSEAAYQTLKKTATQDDGPNNTYNLMVKIISAKLQQYPNLVSEITEAGGSNFILSSTHQPTKQNSVWETGGKNWFIKALNDAYLLNLNEAEPTMQTMSETGILETSVMRSSFEQDIPSLESNDVQDFNPDNAPQGAVILGDDDIKPDETGKKPCIK